MEQWWSTKVGEQIQESEGFPLLGLLSEDDKAQFRGIDGPCGDMSGRVSMAVVRRRSILAGQIRSKNGVGSATLKYRPPISVIREMDVEERNRGNPNKQPYPNEQVPPWEALNPQHRGGFFTWPKRPLFDRAQMCCSG